jgi:hypothetical protein
MIRAIGQQKISNKHQIATAIKVFIIDPLTNQRPIIEPAQMPDFDRKILSIKLFRTPD